jgi:hypothetical protein
MKKHTDSYMPGLRCSLLCCWMLIAFAGSAQFGMEIMPNAKPMDPSVIIYGASNFNNGIPFDKIQGSPFWKDDYQLAFLYGDRPTEKWLVKTKLNLNTAEVYFLGKNGEELVAPEGLVQKIIFCREGDSSKPETEFRYKYGEALLINNDKGYYVQLMNNGNYQLLKLNTRPVITADSFHIAKRYYFKEEVKYFMQYNNKTAVVKKLTRDNILAWLPGNPATEDWMARQKINFKKEEDIVRFLDYYNSKK